MVTIFKFLDGSWISHRNFIAITFYFLGMASTAWLSGAPVGIKDSTGKPQASQSILKLQEGRLKSSRGRGFMSKLRRRTWRQEQHKKLKALEKGPEITDIPTATELVSRRVGDFISKAKKNKNIEFDLANKRLGIKEGAKLETEKRRKLEFELETFRSDVQFLEGLKQLKKGESGAPKTLTFRHRGEERTIKVPDEFHSTDLKTIVRPQVKGGKLTGRMETVSMREGALKVKQLQRSAEVHAGLKRKIDIGDGQSKKLSEFFSGIVKAPESGVRLGAQKTSGSVQKKGSFVGGEKSESALREPLRIESVKSAKPREPTPEELQEKFWKSEPIESVRLGEAPGQPRTSFLQVPGGTKTLQAPRVAPKPPDVSRYESGSLQGKYWTQQAGEPVYKAEVSAAGKPTGRIVEVGSTSKTGSAGGSAAQKPLPPKIGGEQFAAQPPKPLTGGPQAQVPKVQPTKTGEKPISSAEAPQKQRTVEMREAPLEMAKSKSKGPVEQGKVAEERSGRQGEVLEAQSTLTDKPKVKATQSEGEGAAKMSKGQKKKARKRRAAEEQRRLEQEKAATQKKETGKEEREHSELESAKAGQESKGFAPSLPSRASARTGGEDVIGGFLLPS